MVCLFPTVQRVAFALLPYGSMDKLDNLTSIFLTIGSPTLATYSLVLTALNRRWIIRQFSSYNYPNAQQAILVFAALQQSSISINTESTILLASLIALSSNDAWWSTLLKKLDYSHTWSISSTWSLMCVIVAYVFTIVSSFSGDLTMEVNADGQGVGSLWIWLVAVVTGWLLISPQCDARHLRAAMEEANKIAYVATPSHGPVLASSQPSSRYAISLEQDDGDSLFYDERCPVPIYNYARFLSWDHAVEEVFAMFHTAGERAGGHRSVDPGIPWVTDAQHPDGISATNRTGTQAQVEDYFQVATSSQQPSPARRTMQAWWIDVFLRILLASGAALFLQWSTTGAAFLIVWFTPTTGD
ncbi:hypothetical protein H0H92_012349 [Tricholoma furcatifolium]|nr:hypothetical protein H0H92_012349 [Tricholoma furcatifolium]